MAEVVRFYGYEPTRSGFICCPFHDEKTASLKIYPKSFHCFGCHIGGDSIDFVGRLFNLDPAAAAKRLNADFHLGLDLDKPEDSEQLRERRKIQETRRRFNAWREQMLDQLDRAIRVANMMTDYPSTAAEALALVYREPMIDWAGILEHGTIDEMMTIFRGRGGIDRLCNLILKDSQTKSTAA